ncbi:MAG: electron transporter RnfD, partial [Clostridiales bacterium]|nr:electron transporter RnfD [Clostridiales bacterium]
MTLMPSNNNIYYTGRIDFLNVNKPKIYYAGSSIRINFKGTGVIAKIRNYRFYNHMYLGVIIDGKESK